MLWADHFRATKLTVLLEVNGQANRTARMCRGVNTHKLYWSPVNLALSLPIEFMWWYRIISISKLRLNHWANWGRPVQLTAIRFTDTCSKLRCESTLDSSAMILGDPQTWSTLQTRNKIPGSYFTRNILSMPSRYVLRVSQASLAPDIGSKYWDSFYGYLFRDMSVWPQFMGI